MAFVLDLSEEDDRIDNPANSVQLPDVTEVLKSECTWAAPGVHFLWRR